MDMIVDASKRAGVAALTTLPEILGAVAILVIGVKIINRAAPWMQRKLEYLNSQKPKKVSARSFSSMFSSGSREEENENEGDEDLERQETHRVDPTLLKFAVSFASNGLKALLFIIVAPMVGISTTSFAAVLSMSSLAIGLALQGLLKDFAAGVMLLVFRKYDVGDLIDIKGVVSMVKVVEIALFETVVCSLDNKTIAVPNGQINIVTNLSEQRRLRVDVALKIGHDTGLRAAKDVLLQLLKASPGVLQEPAPEVLVSEVDVLGKELIMRAWVRKADYIPVPPALREEAILSLEEAGLALARWPSSPFQPLPPAAAEGAAAAAAAAVDAGPQGLPTLLTSRAVEQLPRAAADLQKAEVA